MILNAVEQKLFFLSVFESLLLANLNLFVIKLAEFALVGTRSFFLFPVSETWLQNELLNLTVAFKQPGIFWPHLFAFCDNLYLKCDCEAKSDCQSDGLLLVRQLELHSNLFHFVTDLLNSALNAIYEFVAGNLEFLPVQILTV